MKSPYHITILVSSWTAYGRGIIEGIWQYAQRHGPWLLSLDPAEPDGRRRLPIGSVGDGIIAAIHTPQLAEQLAEAGVPVVGISGTLMPGVDFPRVQSDPDAVVRLAVEHLRGKGLRQIAFCGEPHRPFAEYWTEAFRRVMSESDAELLIYAPRRRLSQKTPKDTHHREMRHWLEQLPKPVGVIGWATSICRHVAMSCTESGMQVPDEVAIIALETEDLLGRVIYPPISGVDIPVEEIGYRAASLLDQCLKGEPLTERQILLQPLGVTSRQSTDVLMVDDSIVGEVLRYIRDNATEGIDVSNILKAIPVARRTLERRFHAFLGRTPAQEIRRVKLEAVRELLRTTSMTLPQIAEACGFNYVEHMIPPFKDAYQCTPAVYRKRVISRPR